MRTDDLHDRLKIFRQHLGLKQSQMADRLGIRQSSYATIELGVNNLKTEHIINIINNDKVNPAWLLTGEGEMFLGEVQSEDKLPMPIHLGLKETPIFSMKAFAGEMVEQYEPAFKAEVALLPRFTFRMQFIMEIEGDSMHPTYASGDLVVITQANFDEIIDDKVYILQTKANEVLLKRVVADHDRRCYMLRSDNKHKYKAFLLNEEDIIYVFRVLGKFIPADAYDSK